MAIKALSCEICAWGGSIGFSGNAATGSGGAGGWFATGGMSCASGGDVSGGLTGSGKAADATADMPAGDVSELGVFAGGLLGFGPCGVLLGGAAADVV